MQGSKKKIGTDTRVFVSRSLLRMSTVKDSRGRTLFRGHFTVDSDPIGILIFLDMFPSEAFPKLCRYTFVRANGTADIVDSVNSPALDIEFDMK